MSCFTRREFVGGSLAAAILAVAKATRATLTAKFGGVANDWDWWFFPKRSPLDGSGVYVAPEFQSRIGARLRGRVHSVAAADTVIAPADGVLADEALPTISRLSWGEEVVAKPLFDAAGRRVHMMPAFCGRVGARAETDLWYNTHSNEAFIRSNLRVRPCVLRAGVLVLAVRVGRGGV